MAVPGPAVGTRRYCDVAFPHSRLEALTYHFDPNHLPAPEPGDCMLVPLRGKLTAGVIVRLRDQPGLRQTKEVKVMLAAGLLPADLLGLGDWVRRYYLSTAGETFGHILPRRLCTPRMRPIFSM